MRLTCPLCGPRDRREFYYYGSDAYLTRPAPEDAEGWDNHLHLRDNPAGRTRDLWYHEAGCTSWLLVERDTVTHEIFSVAQVEGSGASGGSISGQKKPAKRKGDGA